MDQMSFYDVFPNMDAENDLEAALSDATVTKVSTGRNKDDIRIYVTFNTLIPKRRIWHLEKSIKKQFFPNNGVTIKILEDFDLSSQYTPSNLISSYNDSILEELEDRSALLFNIYKKADLDVTEDGHLKVTIEDTVIGREKEHELFPPSVRPPFRSPPAARFLRPPQARAGRASCSIIRQESCRSISSYSIPPSFRHTVDLSFRCTHYTA